MTGIGDPVDGVYVIDFPDFALSLAIVATSLMSHRPGRASSPGMPGPAQERAWAALREQHARAMPV